MSKKISKRKKRIKYKEARVVLSDILPYEIPLTFSNRHFYDFIIKNKIKLKNNKKDKKLYLYWKKDDEELTKIIELLFNINTNNNITEEKEVTNNHSITYWKYALPNNGNKPYNSNVLTTIPFSFKISHKNDDYRELTIIHPINQLAITNFYNKYKYLIIYYSNLSPFSIRKPHKIAKYTFFKDKKHQQKKSDEPNDEIIEEFGKEYKNLKTFFAVEYNNIYKFYESYLYHRNEKKFEKLHKFDITKCFDSIYTHSLSWALQNKNIVKTHLKENSFTFSGSFDTLMQKLNYNETNGIVIGPEFSRIFAELILQSIDFEVFKELEKKKIKHKIDYSLFRYVDDYFLFYNDEETKKFIVDTFIHELKKYKLYINDSKSITYTKPIITELSIAKSKISNLLNKLIIFKIEKDTEENIKKYSFNINAKYGIIRFKTIVKESGIEYKDILNYTFSIIDNKIYKILKKYDKENFNNDENIKNQFKQTFINSIIELIDLITFLYVSYPRVNTTVKVSSILSKIIKYIKQKKDNGKKYFNKEQQDIVFKKIFDEISFILSKNKLKKYTQIESLYLLVILQNLGRSYRLDKQQLFDYFNVNVEKKEFKYPLEYWSITVLLFYIKNLKRYKELREILQKEIIKKLNSYDNIRIHTEAILLIFDILACPYLDKDFKREVLNVIPDFRNRKMELINKIGQNNWFTKWTDFNIERELNTKKSKEVY